MHSLSNDILVGRLLDAMASAPSLPTDLLSEWGRRIATRTLSDSDFLCILYALKTRLGLRYDGQAIVAVATGLHRAHDTPRELSLHDNSGTGGGSVRTVNISSAAAVVSAAGGVQVLKHGFRGVTGRCGSRNVLLAAGVNCMCEPAQALRSVIQSGIGYVDFECTVPYRFRYPTYSPLNDIGPLAHPFALYSRVLATSDRRFYESMCAHAGALSIHRLALVYNERIDEVDLWSPSLITVFGLDHGRDAGHTIEFDPSLRSYARPRQGPDGIDERGSAEENWRVLAEVLSGSAGHDNDLCTIIAVNAGLGMWVHGLVPSLEDGIDGAHDILRRGVSMDVMSRWLQSQGVSR